MSLFFLGLYTYNLPLHGTYFLNRSLLIFLKINDMKFEKSCSRENKKDFFFDALQKSDACKESKQEFLYVAL